MNITTIAAWAMPHRMNGLAPLAIRPLPSAQAWRQVRAGTAVAASAFSPAR